MELEDQLKLHKELSRQIADLEEKKKALGSLILEQFQGKSLEVNQYLVRRNTRLSIRLSLEQARLYDCTKMEEVVDKDRVKELHKKGEPIEGVSEYEYVTITSRAEKEVTSSS